MFSALTLEPNLSLELKTGSKSGVKLKSLTAKLALRFYSGSGPLDPQLQGALILFKPLLNLNIIDRFFDIHLDANFKTKFV